MAALMLTASLAGCGSSEKAESASDPSHGGAGKEEELLTIDMFCAPANYQGVQTGWFGKAIKDACNVEVNIIAPNVAGGGDSLYQTRSAAGNLGDLIVIRKDQLEDCYKAGLLYDMTDFVANSKNLKNYSKSSENLSKLLGTDRIYAFANSSSLLSPMEPAWTAVNPSMAIRLRTAKRYMDSPCLRTGTASGCAVPPSVPGLMVTLRATPDFCLPTGMPAITHSWMMRTVFIIRC